MLDTRRHLKELIDEAYSLSLKFIFTAFTLSFLLAYLIVYLPEYSLSYEARTTLFILLFAAGLWISEAIPAFAVSLLVIALEIILLGFPGFNFADNSNGWQEYLAPLSSPLIFLFLAGFIMAAAASKTKLDIWISKKILSLVGNRPHNIISALVGLTFILSMFISNTATAAMMVSILLPIYSHIKPGNPFGKSMFLAVMIGANLGGMATIIGTPPNAIAVGILGLNAPSFIFWMFLALPPALFVTFLLRYLIIKLYPSNEEFIDLRGIESVNHFDDSTQTFSTIPTLPSWKKYVTMIIFTLTILLWLSGPLHHIPTTVVSLVPIIGFTLFKIIDADDIATLRWDVIILIIGGLSLGLAVSKSGLDIWFARLLHFDTLNTLLLMFIFSYVAVVISNFMSNTAATNILLPIVISVAISISEYEAPMVVIAVALSTSFAMALAVSTPPNAIIFASKKVDGREFIRIGLIAALLGPLSVIGWLWSVSHFFNF